MNTKLSHVLLTSILFTILFYNQTFGINIIVFEWIVLAWLYYKRNFYWKENLQKIIISFLVLSSIMVVFVHTDFSILMNLFSFFLFIGSLLYSQARSLFTIFRLTLSNILKPQITFLNELKSIRIKGYRLFGLYKTLTIIILPIFIIFIFIIIYQISNPVFDGIMNNLISYFNIQLNFLLNNIDWRVIFTLTFGVWISNIIFLRFTNNQYLLKDQMASNKLIRKRKKYKNGMMSLKYEMKAGVFLFISLNLILLIVNCIDIQWVWFNFQWQGQYLKQFVHEGTYLLIFSILIAVGLVMYFFRNNLNFYKQNRTLKILSYIWIIQNIILIISVGIRNYYYIENFSLAYRRIGVIIFLIMTLLGLISVMIKVYRGYSGFYLMKYNSLSVYVILMVSSFINWDRIIASYNFNHAHESFLHLDFLAELPDQTLPYLDHSKEELLDIHRIQQSKFKFETKYMTPEEYYNEIQYRKNIFKNSWESKSILSWNWPEYDSYKAIQKAD